MLASTLLEFGFDIADARDTLVTLVSDRHAIRLSYNREDLPHPWLSVTVGVSEVAGGVPAFVALWRAFPDEPELQDPDVMEIRSQKELDECLVRVRDGWFPRFILPLLESEDHMRGTLIAQKKGVFLEYESRAREQHLREARSRYERADYQGAVDSYTLAGVDSLKAADTRRLAIARRNLHEGRAT